MAEAAEREQARIEQAARAAAQRYQDIWQTAFQGVNGLLGALKQTVFQSLEDSGLTGRFTAWAGGLGESIGNRFGETFGTTFSGIFSGLASGGIAAAINFGMAGLRRLGGFLKGLFSISAEALGGKADFVSTAEASVGQTASSQERLQHLIDEGWQRSDAVLHTFFQDQALASGRSLEEADRQWHAYHAAMKNSDAETMAEIEANVLSWHDASSSAAADDEEAWMASFDSKTVESAKMTDEAIANSKRLREAMVEDSRAVLAANRELGAGIRSEVEAWSAAWSAAWSEVRDGATATAAHVTAVLASIPDRVVRVTYAHDASGAAGAGPGGPAARAPVVKVEIGRREFTRVVRDNLPAETARVL